MSSPQNKPKPAKQLSVLNPSPSMSSYIAATGLSTDRDHHLDIMSKRQRSPSTNPTSNQQPLPAAQIDEYFFNRAIKRRKRIAKKIKAQTTVAPRTNRFRSKSIAPLALQPRSYQSELFEKAKNQNVIVCLDTGSGKTLISALLLQHARDLEADRLRERLNSNVVQRENPFNSHQSQNVSQQEPNQPKQKDAQQPPREPIRTLRPRRVSFFLVNLVPLVHQQASAIANNFDLRVGKLYGELKDEIRGQQAAIDTWRLPEWDALLDAHEVIVSTAQCLLDAFIHGFVHMSEINLLIFDEVHHANKAHPFARIMTYYGLAEPCHRPKIFGMTASPLFTIASDFGEAAQHLQKIMDAEILTASSECESELNDAVNNPNQMVIEYDPPADPPLEPTPLAQKLIEACKNVDQDFEKTVWPKIDYSLQQHGPLMSDLVWYGSSQEYETKIQRWSESVRRLRSQHALLSTTWSSGKARQQIIGSEIKLSHLTTDSDLNRSILGVLHQQPKLPALVDIGPHNCSSKVLRLVELLECFGATSESRANFCAIIFVERRQTASSLTELLKRLPQLDFIKPEWIVGHETSNGPAMDWHDQVEVLQRFRTRQPTNLLIATSVAEEGLDIQAANLVIRFDLFARHIAFLQSKGRARSKHSRFVMMAERENLEHHRIISSALITDAKRADWLQDLSQKSDLGALHRFLQEEIEIGDNHFIYEPSTGARLHPQDAPALVSHYTAYLSSEDFPEAKPEFLIQVVDAPVPTFDKLQQSYFVCHLKFPSNSLVREVISAPWRSKRTAKRMAAFEACQQLRDLGALDEFLMPKMIYIPKDADKLVSSAANAISAHERPPNRTLHVPLKEFDGWKAMDRDTMQATSLPAAEPSENETLYATMLPLDAFDRITASSKIRHRPFLMLTKKPLPSTQLLELHVEGRGFASAGRIGPSVKLTLSVDALTKANRFTLLLMQWVCKREWNPEQSPWFTILPLVDPASADSHRFAASMDGSHDTHWQIDWDQVEMAASQQYRPINVSDLVDTNDWMVINTRNLVLAGSYRVAAVRNDLNPYSSPLPGSLEHQKGAESYFNFFRDRVASRSSFIVQEPSANQPLLQVDKIGRFSNLLLRQPSSSLSSEKSQKSHTTMIIPSLHSIHPISLSVAHSGMLLPSILCRFDEALLAQQCNNTLFGGKIDNDALLIALMTPSLRTSFDYERFEFIGDTFLKLIASCHTFTTRIGQTEGELHLANKEIIVNAKLFAEALRVDLWKHVHFSCKILTRKRFYPPGLKRQVLSDAVVDDSIVSAPTKEDDEDDNLKEKDEESQQQEQPQPTTVSSPATAATKGNVAALQDEMGYTDVVELAGTPQRAFGISDGLEDSRSLAAFSTALSITSTTTNKRFELGDWTDADIQEDVVPSPHLYVGDCDPATSPAGCHDTASEKTLSDVVEAILGSIVSSSHSSSSAISMGLQACHTFGLLPSYIESMPDFHSQFSSLTQQALDENWAERVDLSALRFLESKFDIQFRYPHLALEAFTHPSLLASLLPSYQRLEFLGDAFLDYFAVKYLTTELLPNETSPGRLAAMKENMVANATLAAMCETLDLAEFVSSHSEPLKARIADYLTQVRRLRIEQQKQDENRDEKNHDEETRLRSTQYWWALKAPKACADVVESCLGAIVVDSGFNLERGQQFFDSQLLPFFQRYCHPSTTVVSNTKLLARLLTDRKNCTCWSLSIEFFNTDEEQQQQQHEEDPLDFDPLVSSAFNNTNPNGDDGFVGGGGGGVTCTLFLFTNIIAQICIPFRSTHHHSQLLRIQSCLALSPSPCQSYSVLVSLIRSLRWARPFPDASSPPPLLSSITTPCSCFFPLA